MHDETWIWFVMIFLWWSHEHPRAAMVCPRRPAVGLPPPAQRARAQRARKAVGRFPRDADHCWIICGKTMSACTYTSISYINDSDYKCIWYHFLLKWYNILHIFTNYFIVLTQKCIKEMSKGAGAPVRPGKGPSWWRQRPEGLQPSGDTSNPFQ